jgi:hypothetical protein
MKKHRKLVLGLGLMALLGLSAREASAETLTISVYLNGGATPIYSVAGTATSVTAAPGALNLALAGTGYTFSNLGASSNFPGTNTSVGGYISDSGTVTRMGGTGGTLTVVITESGFTAPTGGTTGTLSSAPTSTFSGTTAVSSNLTDVGTYTAATTVSTPMTTLASNGTSLDSHNGSATAGIPAYMTPYTLTDTQTITLTQRSTTNASDSFDGTVTVLSVVPEPASLIMMVTGMPLPLVVMGLLRRRRAAA